MKQVAVSLFILFVLVVPAMATGAMATADEVQPRALRAGTQNELDVTDIVQTKTIRAKAEQLAASIEETREKARGSTVENDVGMLLDGINTSEINEYITNGELRAALAAIAAGTMRVEEAQTLVRNSATRAQLDAGNADALNRERAELQEQLAALREKMTREQAENESVRALLDDAQTMLDTATNTGTETVDTLVNASAALTRAETGIDARIKVIHEAEKEQAEFEELRTRIAAQAADAERLLNTYNESNAQERAALERMRENLTAANGSAIGTHTLERLRAAETHAEQLKKSIRMRVSNLSDAEYTNQTQMALGHVTQIKQNMSDVKRQLEHAALLGISGTQWDDDIAQIEARLREMHAAHADGNFTAVRALYNETHDDLRRLGTAVSEAVKEARERHRDEGARLYFVHVRNASMTNEARIDECESLITAYGTIERTSRVLAAYYVSMTPENAQALEAAYSWAVVYNARAADDVAAKVARTMTEERERLFADRNASTSGSDVSDEYREYITKAITDSAENGTENALSAYVTPDALAIQSIVEEIGGGYDDVYYWVAENVVWISDLVFWENESSASEDYWIMPSALLEQTPEKEPFLGTIKSDCEEQANLLASMLIASGKDAESVRVVIGSVDFGTVGGHAWVEVFTETGWMVLDPTTGPYIENGTLVERDALEYNYFAYTEYPVVERWAAYNNEYYIEFAGNATNAPVSWLYSFASVGSLMALEIADAAIPETVNMGLDGELVLGIISGIIALALISYIALKRRE